MRQDMYSQLNYEMIVSDFIIGNNNNPVLMDASVSITEKPVAKPIRKNIPTKKLFKKKVVVPAAM
jgi:hypothetical protein